MRNTISAAFVAATFLLSNLALAEDSKPIELTAAQMDQVTASGLLLPNAKEVFVNLQLQNGAPHPALANSPVLGPWQAHFNSPVIDFIPPE